MSVALAGPAASIANTIFSYFSPSKSPFYSIIAFGTVALIISCKNIEDSLWLPIAIPVWLVLAIALMLALQDKPAFEPGQHEDQLRFARSFSISSALLAIVLTSQSVDKNLAAFWCSYIACFSQVLVFLLYTWARGTTEASNSAINFVQFALITTTLIVGASFGLTQYVEHPPKPEEIFAVGNRYLYTTIGLYSLWGACIVRWIKHVMTLIGRPEPEAVRAKSE